LVVGQRRFVAMVAIGNGDFLFLETEMPGFFPEPEFRSERRDEIMAEPAPGIRELSQGAGEWFPESPEPPPPTTPPEKPSLDEEGNSILDFFQGIIRQKPPPPIEDELEQ